MKRNSTTGLFVTFFGVFFQQIWLSAGEVDSTKTGNTDWHSPLTHFLWRISGSDTSVDDHINFRLYTRSNDRILAKIHWNDTGTLNSFKPHRPIKVIAHGFSESGDGKWLLDLKDAFLKLDDCNVIIVDWGYLAEAPFYGSAVNNTKIVGERTAKLLNWLLELHVCSLSDIHVIGFSLGAHVAGFTGKNIRYGKVARITGLDPAYPLFELATSKQRLDVTDAEFVDVIHTNSGPIFEESLSFKEPLGDVDFYPNGGSRQPGCEWPFNSDLKSIFANGFNLACAHRRAHDYFLESTLNPKAFWSYPCKSGFDGFDSGTCFRCDDICNRMGFYADSEHTGVRYLATRSQTPFNGRPVHIFLEIDAEGSTIFTRGRLTVGMDSDEFVINSFLEGLYNTSISRTVSVSEKLSMFRAVNLTYSRLAKLFTDELPIRTFELRDPEHGKRYLNEDSIKLKTDETVKIEFEELSMFLPNFLHQQDESEKETESNSKYDIDHSTVDRLFDNLVF